METTIKLHSETKTQLDLFREYVNESYDEVIRKMIYIVQRVEKEPELSMEAVKAIEQARERMKKGRLVTEKMARKRLGL